MPTLQEYQEAKSAWAGAMRNGENPPQWAQTVIDDFEQENPGLNIVTSYQDYMEAKSAEAGATRRGLETPKWARKTIEKYEQENARGTAIYNQPSAETAHDTYGSSPQFYDVSSDSNDDMEYCQRCGATLDSSSFDVECPNCGWDTSKSYKSRLIWSLILTVLGLSLTLLMCIVVVGERKYTNDVIYLGDLGMEVFLFIVGIILSGVGLMWFFKTINNHSPWRNIIFYGGCLIALICMVTLCCHGFALGRYVDSPEGKAELEAWEGESLEKTLAQMMGYDIATGPEWLDNGHFEGYVRVEGETTSRKVTIYFDRVAKKCIMRVFAANGVEGVHHYLIEENNIYTEYSGHYELEDQEQGSVTIKTGISRLGDIKLDIESRMFEAKGKYFIFEENF